MVAIDYRVIQRSAIPDPEPPNKDNYGEWTAMMRLLRGMESSEAIEIHIGDMDYTNVIGSLHCAAKKTGIKISTMRVNGTLYVVRTAKREIPKVKPTLFRCGACNEGKRGRKGQKYCQARACQRERHRRNLEAASRRKEG